MSLLHRSTFLQNSVWHLSVNHLRHSNQSHLILVNRSDKFETLIFSLLGFVSDKQNSHSKRFGCSSALGLSTAESSVCHRDKFWETRTKNLSFLLLHHILTKGYHNPHRTRRKERKPRYRTVGLGQTVLLNAELWVTERISYLSRATEEVCCEPKVWKLMSRFSVTLPSQLELVSIAAKHLIFSFMHCLSLPSYIWCLFCFSFLTWHLKKNQEDTSCCIFIAVPQFQASLLFSRLKLHWNCLKLWFICQC